MFSTDLACVQQRTRSPSTTTSPPSWISPKQNTTTISKVSPLSILLVLPSAPTLTPSELDENWTHSETLYLFSLLRTYDLRFVIVADRYAYPGEGDEYADLPGGGKKQSIEDIKSRYYSICRRLVRSRPTGDENGKLMLLQSYAFDKGIPFPPIFLPLVS